MTKVSKKLIIFGALGVVGLLTGLALLKGAKPTGDIRGVMYHEPSSCLNAGVGCLESYITTDEGEHCSIDSDTAEKYKGKRVVISGEKSLESMGHLSVCDITIQSIRSL